MSAKSVVPVTVNQNHFTFGAWDLGSGAKTARFSWAKTVGSRLRSTTNPISCRDVVLDVLDVFNSPDRHAVAEESGYRIPRSVTKNGLDQDGTKMLLTFPSEEAAPTFEKNFPFLLNQEKALFENIRPSRLFRVSPVRISTKGEDSLGYPLYEDEMHHDDEEEGDYDQFANAVGPNAKLKPISYLVDGDPLFQKASCLNSFWTLMLRLINHVPDVDIPMNKISTVNVKSNGRLGVDIQYLLDLQQAYPIADFCHAMQHLDTSATKSVHGWNEHGDGGTCGMLTIASYSKNQEIRKRNVFAKQIYEMLKK